MKLYYKFIFSRVAFTIISFVFFILYISFFVMSSFERVEDDFANSKLLEIKGVMDEKVQDLYSANLDWAVWSDTYHFAKDRNEEYAISNLSEIGYLSTGADMILYLDLNNEVVYNSLYNKVEETEEKIPANLINRFKSLEIPADEQGFSGICVFDDEPLIVSKFHIVDDSETKAIGGALVMARFINTKFLRELSEIVREDLSYAVLVDEQETLDPIVKIGREIELNAAFVSLKKGSSFVLRTKVDRQVYGLGKRTVKKMVVVLLLMMLTSIMLSSYLLRESVLKSINKLLKEIRAISSKMEKSEQLRIEGNDEFAELKSGINSMLDNLEVARMEIAKREEKYKTLYEESAAIHLVLNEKSEFIDINNAMTKFLGLKKEEIIGKNIYEFVSENDTGWLKEYIENVFLGMDNEDIDIGFNLLDGTEKTLHLYPNCLFLSEDNDKFSILITGSDVTERIEMTRKLEEMATFDPMTGAFNRRVGLQMLSKRMKHVKRYKNDLSICFIDVNGLKKVNDTFGHNAGDDLINDSAEVLKTITRDSDIVVRLGGDEFLIILPNCSSEQAEEVWDRVLEVLDEINEYKEDYKISMSHGIVQYDFDEEWTMDEFVEIADQKMYQEKLKTKQARFI